MRVFSVWSWLMLGAVAGQAWAVEPLANWTLKNDDVVFMYPVNDHMPQALPRQSGQLVVPMDPKSDASAYKAYGVTVLGWGGAHTREAVAQARALGIHPTGTAWCLTAGAQDLHNNPDLADATCRDITGAPIVIPWQVVVYEGTPTWFGCSNHPAFRGWVRKRVAEAMSGGADGLHVDDYMGTAHVAARFGGCFCDYCMSEFRQWLMAHSTPQLLAAAKVESFEKFDYRELVRQYAKTREDYLKVQNKIPLHTEFVDCQVQLAVEHVRSLGRTASEIVHRPITLSANTGLPWAANLAIAPYLSYMVGEVDHHAAKGTTGLDGAVAAYRMAEALDKPIASTATGTDWAYVSEHKAENLVKVWIALSYAGGQRLMTPNRAWCFTKEKGAFWYDGPREAYAPMYQFVRQHSQLFCGLKAVGPMAIPAGLPKSFNTTEERKAFVAALNRGNPQPATVAKGVWGFPRTGAELSVIHLVNLNYDGGKDALAVQRDVVVKVPGDWFGKSFKEATVYRPDGEEVKVAIEEVEGQLTVRVPELTHWAVVSLR